MKKPSAKAIKLLVEVLDGGSGVETTRGTKALWGQLEKAGLVTKMPHGGFLGHPFFFDITDAGRAAIREVKGCTHSASEPCVKIIQENTDTKS